MDVLLSVTGQGVKRSVDTRWNTRAEEVTASVTIVNHFLNILSALEKLKFNCQIQIHLKKKIVKRK